MRFENVLAIVAVALAVLAIFQDNTVLFIVLLVIAAIATCYAIATREGIHRAFSHYFVV
jgi:hypothetical protein